MRGERGKMKRVIKIVESDSEIKSCFPVLSQLRTDLSEEDFLIQAKRQINGGRYSLSYLLAEGQIVAVAGFWISECLAWGKFLYVDDLVTGESYRNAGHGEALLDWLIGQARDNDCAQLHLDSGVQRFAAHRFYLRQRMSITSHHFALKI